MFVSTVTDQSRKFPTGFVETYRYGMNGMEKDDEISGNGNVYTAMHWEYDARLGRRWNLDPVKKPWQSDYACFSNSPIWKVDPNGDDDYFNSDGSFSHSTKTGSQIFVQTAKGNMLFSQVPTNSMHNRQVLASVTEYYAKQVGITGVVGVSNHPKSSARKDGTLAFTTGNSIYVNAKGGGISPLFDDANNLKSALEHEKDHKDKRQGFSGASNFEHAQVYLNQVQGASFGKTTSDFKAGMAGSISKYLGDAALEVGGAGGTGDFTELNNLVGEFNKLSKKTGYTFTLVQTQGGYSNPEMNEYKVYATPVKKSKK